MICSCGSEIPFSDPMWRCSKCDKRLCLSCMAAKVYPYNLFICPACAVEFKPRKFAVDAKTIRGAKSSDSFAAWAIVLQDDIVRVDIDGIHCAGYSKNIDQVARLADIIIANRPDYDAFKMVRVWMPKESSIRPLRILANENQRVEVV